ncbi:protein SAWADEE HOMEODOMAIN HOMOLOG 1-like isoform X1 [Ziziphus jujuba]|uniref:Protein SAWADEE HOMEODOMAIN HOMOLOG 1-like isoform X1 n=1 Tax=Ziziphus jujuba TaxID=326968 RepID=A0A6P4BSR6_ZIZJJ|nr:protein SAWADEE HOMEODOMAIN HOMOLOG 1-like isoform X1 [Ziziphus jujuba]
MEEMSSSSENWDSLSEFTLKEIVEMENLYKEVGEQSLDKEFCQDVAMRYSCKSSRAGKPSITWEQVHKWFQNKHEGLQAKSTSPPAAFKLSVDLSGFSVLEEPESSQKPEGKGPTDISELAFEAKSLKDNAWYDVASFLSYRVLCSGELEVRVRFSGFGKEEDEWVNVRNAVRERSIPLEPSECHKVNVGDLVLCFQDRENHAIYCDAHVIEIQRKFHDIGDCRCIFVVRYDEDYTVEKVHLGRICSRPAGCDWSANTDILAFTDANTDIDAQQEMCVDEKLKLSFLY